ncbi:MAG TPA: T9SS type A sorting domain-containing protein [Chitinophagales bacterium]|nr:T9SS type A sorting domain-containing protein [Chitinophagales bacterium]
MKNIYTKISYLLLFCCFLLLSNNTFAQKNLKLRITNISAATSAGTDCDANCIGLSNNRLDWVFDIDDGGTDVNEDCYNLSDDNNNNSIAPNFVAFDQNYDYGCQWPSGNIDFNVEGWDEDCADACIGGGFANVVSDLICRVNVNRAFPVNVNGTYGSYTATCNYNANYDGNGNCGGTITVTYQWEVSGNWRSQASDDYICGANDLGTLGLGSTLTRNNFNNIGYSHEDICAANEPNLGSGDESVWMKFKTGPNPGTNINVDASAIGGSGTGGVCLFGETVAAWCKVYEGPDNLVGCPFSYSTNHFTQISQVGSTGLDLSDIDIKCPKPNQTYYVQVEICTPGVQVGCLGTCDQGRFNLNVTDNGRSAGPDKICNALSLDAYPAPLSNTTNTDLFINNQSNACATVASGEPDVFPVQGVDKSVWYKFTTPAPPAGSTTLQHTYAIEVNRLSSSASTSWPTFAVYRETSATTRTCSPENGASFANLSNLDYTQNLDFGDASVNLLCLEPSSIYYIQVDHASTPWPDEYIDFSIRVRKDAFRPSDNICGATDLGIITQTGTAAGNPTGVNWTSSSKFSGAPYFNLPHTNKCASGEPGEPNATPGGPGTSGSHSATVWYKFITGNTVPDWIYWYNNDDVFGNGNRGGACLLGSTFNSEVSFFKNTSSFACPVGGNLELQDEMNISGDLCDHTTGIGFGAPCYNDMFRLKCPEPNTTYYVQVTDAGFISTCYEGLWSFDNGSYKISTAPGIGGAPINDTICGAIDLGGTYVSGALSYSTNANGNGTNIFDNFCATPDFPWRADFTQPLDRDVWFRFKPPLSGSVKILAQSAPSGQPSGVDDDLDLQIAIWEPILGDGTNAHCSDPRFLWTPIISQDHGVCELSEQQTGFTNCFLGGFFPYDIYNTCGNSATCNEGNSLIATCLDPNKYYYIQVDGGDWATCDLIDAGDCISGYFKMQVLDAGLGLYNSASPGDVGTPFTSLGVPNSTLKHDEPCFSQLLTVNASATAYGSLNWTNMTNRCATSINDPIPSVWQSRNASTDKTVWASFVAPASGKVKIRAENIAQIKGDADYHDDINLQLALYETPTNCFDKNRFSEIGSGNGFDGGAVEIDPLNSEDYTGICVPCVGSCGFDEYMVSRCLIPGKTYYIMIDGDAGYTCGADVEDIEGDFRISVQALNGIPASTNDSICMAYNMTPIGNAAGSVYNSPIPFNNECATIDQSYEGNGKVAHEIAGTLFNFDVEHTLWFKFVAPATGKVKIEAIEDGGVDDIDLGLAIFDIPSQNCANIQSGGYKFDQDYDPAIFGIANSDDEEITVECLVPGRTYWVQVDGNRNVTTCGPLLSGTDCETGQFRMKITTLTAPQTYASNVNYSTPVTSQPGGNDRICQAHQVYNAGGTLNIFNQNTFLNPGETINFTHNNRCATAEQNEPEANGWDLNPFDQGSDPTVWYTFNTGPSLGPLRPGDITIRVTNPSGICFDPDLDLYEYNGNFTTASCNTQATTNSQFNNLLRVGEGKVFNILSPREEEIKITCPKANTRYMLRVLGTSTCPLFGSDQGDFDISISMSNINLNFQTNDDICGATNVGSGNLTTGSSLSLLNQNNICATQQQGEPNTTQSAVQNEPEYDETMWHKFTTSANPGAVQVVLQSLIGIGGFNAVPSITVYKFSPTCSTCSTPCSISPFSGLGEVASNSGFATLLGTVTIDSAKVTLPCVSPNTTYYIQVDGGDASLFGITVPTFTDNFYYNLTVRDLGVGTGRPINDDLANAIPVDNVAPIDGILTAAGSLTINGHNRCATCETGENADYCGLDQTDHTNSNEDETVWYYFTTPSKPGVITIIVADDPAVTSEVIKPNFKLYYNDGTGAYYRTTSAPSGKLIQEGSSADNLLNNASVTNSFTCLLPNTKYWIQVDGNDIATDQGSFIVTVTDDGSGNPGPSNDLICNAENLSIPTGVLGRTNKCSWEESGEPNTSDNMGGSGDDVESNNYDETVWFTFTVPVSADVTMVLEPTSGINGGVNYVLYEKTGTANISCVGSPADIPSWLQLNEIASGSGLALNTIGTTDRVTETWPCLDPAKRYYIQVDGNDLIGSNDVGNFNIELTSAVHAVPVNDNICGIGATVGNGNFGTFTTTATQTATLQDNRCATQEVGEPNINGPFNDFTDGNYDHTLWYKFTASNTDGTYNVSVTNSGGDPINASIVVYRQNTNVCSGAIPSFSNMSEIKASPAVNSVTNDESLNLECWEIEEGKTYFIQIQGWDGIGGLDAGTNFNVALSFTAGSTYLPDNICTAPTVPVNGVNQSADNRCATSQTGEPNISPVPQSPVDGSAYDETLWYQFVAPASGEVRLNTSSYSSLLLSLNASLYLAPVGYNCGVSGFNGLVREDNTSTLTSVSSTWDLKCLMAGRIYYIQFDGNDLFTDKGTWNFNLTNLDNSPTPPLNDEPCGAIDVTQFVRSQAQGPCTSDGQYYTNNYSIDNSVSPNVDNATRTQTAIGCNGDYNCNDYWFKFTVPLDATGIRIQGNDEYPGPLNNSVENIGIFRATGGCSGTLQQINCGSGGLTADVDYTLAAFPGETLYVQVFNENAPTNPSNTGFGFCISVDCPPKTTCGTNSLTYGQAQCWNMNTNGNNLTPRYYDCLPGSNNSVNYFTFTTDCDGTPVDTVTVVFSVTAVGCGATAMSLFLDNTPCDAPVGSNSQGNDLLVNCAVFQEVSGGTTATNFNQTYILPACNTYVMQIISDENTAGCASSGQVIIIKSTQNPTTVLPIELTTFTGYNDGALNVLNWTTSSERNSLKFEVEKSLDGTNFTYIGERPAAGNSSTPRDYTLNDEHPVTGNNYYRLKMVDIDGQFKYSDVILIKVAQSEITDGILNVYPNPTNDKLNIVYQAGAEQQLNLNIFNAIGQSMMNNQFKLDAGIHTIVVDAIDYAKGMYIIKLQNTDSGERFNSKFVKE